MPGPILVFDKSALQDLSDDEAFPLDAFFLTNIVPTFFVEVLGDLAKESAQGIVPEQMVGALAEKTPRYHASVSAFHGQLTTRIKGDSSARVNPWIASVAESAIRQRPPPSKS